VNWKWILAAVGFGALLWYDKQHIADIKKAAELDIPEPDGGKRRMDPEDLDELAEALAARIADRTAPPANGGTPPEKS